MQGRFLALLLAAMLASCAPVPPEAPEGVRAPPPQTLVRGHYEALARKGQTVFEVDTAHSIVTVEVGRGGRLASLGHDHVVASHSVAGYVAPDEGDADLSIPLRSLTVDEPELRRAAGFTTQPSPADVEGTRANMLGEVLHADEQPFASVRVRGMRGTAGHVALDPSVTLNGATRTVKADVSIERMPDAIRIAGRMTILQTDFGLVPYSVLGGAIQVKDALDVRFDIVATRLAS